MDLPFNKSLLLYYLKECKEKSKQRANFRIFIICKVQKSIINHAHINVINAQSVYESQTRKQELSMNKPIHLWTSLV